MSNGLAIAAFPVGALLAGLAAGVLIRRFRSSRVAVVGTMLTALGVLAAGVSGTWALLAAGLLLAGAMDAITDVAQNAHVAPKLSLNTHAEYRVAARNGRPAAAGARQRQRTVAAARGNPGSRHARLP